MQREDGDTMCGSQLRLGESTELKHPHEARVQTEVDIVSEGQKPKKINVC